MSSTTPAPERTVRGTGAGESARCAPGEPMRALLAACAAAEAVSTPPEPEPRQADDAETGAPRAA
ncbi:hypothetical protein F7Q99_10205 [Streptomyces kaniharaensis]|uniref:Uncharacterized protein n=1 Tax=Streptomyces kaniharaensis TaxID=212423 RepID=A0A6N7KMK8_9ACTN|nr:hypothetical protein [Streptomyces kaniharaensis]MQS12651.1 hypothetical protein [Streptomyces kaniharaensis]